MESYKTITTNFSNYNLEKLIEMERYVCFDNIAEGSMQALLNNDTKKKTDNKTLTYQDSENSDDNMPVDTSTISTLQKSSESAADSAVDENQILLKEDNEDNDCEVLDDETISIQAPQGVQNSLRIIRRERPFKCCFISSIEKEQN
ncbi:13316_t:CDS:2 [Racocetra fulgida]|uniref:13316_t:CDS:1 n=1 Tax=Racocetra fulgida TaxID=60492 RepID=A0A9N9BJJ8_9GLOM|nr:13316_t:CDS:2 [Racocetra fulgida]